MKNNPINHGFDEGDLSHFVKDPGGLIRELLHFQRPFVTKAQIPQMAAREYLDVYSKTYGINPEQLKNLGLHAETHPIDASIEYRYLQEISLFDSTTVTYQQTYFGLPVWRAGLALTMKRNPVRVLSSKHSGYSTIRVERPSAESLKKFDRITDQELASILGIEAKKEENKKNENKQTLPTVKSRRLIVYQYDAEKRLRDWIEKDPKTGRPVDIKPVLELPAVAETIKDNEFYVACEIIFNYYVQGWGKLAWTAVVDVETESVLYLRALVDSVDGMVFLTDPLTATGDPATVPSASNTVLNPLRTSETLLGLSAPAAGANQALTGDLIEISDFIAPTAAPPTEPPGGSFNFDVRTNDFAAVNAYYNCDRFFRLVQDLGFDLSTYFGSVFAIPVDHRATIGTNGIEVNAQCPGNGAYGIASVKFALADLSDTTHPMGISADWRVCLHELGGHGVLYHFINGPNYGFAHSAGDSFAAILNDAGSLAPDRFLTFPWVGIDRRHDRDVASGWAWGGSHDIGSYSSEQILSTTMFRFYRSIGGDSADINMQRFAARVTCYLMLRAISTFSLANYPSLVSDFASALTTVDQLDWTSEGLSGGAYGKVARWAFEKQGLYQPPGAPGPVTTPGAPPPVDVYIDDGRAGEYTYQSNWYSNQSVWNRRHEDGEAGHEEPWLGVSNYAYVTVKNRGTSTATNVKVKAFHCFPGVGLTYPDDWQPMTTAELSAPDIPPGGEVTVGPFEWVPSQPDHECIFMVASADGDPSNLDNFGPGDSIPEWRLVPNDNNIGQRNVAPTAGGGGLNGLLKCFAERRFWVHNPFATTARIEVKVEMAKFLKERGYNMVFSNPGGKAFSLEPGQSKEMVMTMKPGKDFTAKEVEKASDSDRTIRIETRANGILVGGMAYHLDPTMTRPSNTKPGGDTSPGDCGKVTEDLLKRLKLGQLDIKEIKLRKVGLDIIFKDDCDCD